MTDSASYNEKVDVYSFGIIVWAVCRYMEIGTITPLPNKTEHHKLMNPYPGPFERPACPFFPPFLLPLHHQQT